MTRLTLAGLVVVSLSISACASPAPAATSRASLSPTLAAASPVPIATPGGLPVLAEGPIEPGTYAVPPGRYGWAQCEFPPTTGCPSEPPHAGSMLAQISVPGGGWEAGDEGTVIVSPQGTEGPDGAALILRWSGLTTGLHADPCLPVSHLPTDIAVGVTVDDFIGAVVAHPALQVTEPAEIQLDGYSGRFFTLTGPSDISGCNNWRPWEPGIFVQGPDNIWRVWAIDVDGLRVILLTEEFAGTSAEVNSELAAMVESIRFLPTP